MSTEQDEAAREADAQDRAEAHALELEARWEAEKIEELNGDPEHDEWWWGRLSFAARPGTAGAGWCAVCLDPAEGQEIMRREDMIQLRDFLTHAIEGTLEPVADLAEQGIPGSEF